MSKNKELICIISWMICLIAFPTIAMTVTPGEQVLKRLVFVFLLGIGLDILALIHYNNRGEMRINTKVEKTDKTIYHREPPFDYSPVIITYLQNLKIEFKKDFIAEIAFLINKKILKLEKINNEYYIDFYTEKEEKNVNTNNQILYKNLVKRALNNSKNREQIVTLNSQAAILKYITGKIKLQELIKKLENDKYYIQSCYEEDCINLGYLEKGRTIEKINTKLLYIITTILLIPTIVIIFKIMKVFGLEMLLETILMIFMISLLYSVTFISIANKVKSRTQKAKEEYAEWLAFIDFIKEYSYLNERKLQELEIWDEYLTYSIAFGVTKIDTLLKV